MPARLINGHANGFAPLTIWIRNRLSIMLIYTAARGRHKKFDNTSYPVHVTKKIPA